LFTAYDWMNARPHGARVVPIVAVTAMNALVVSGMLGTTSPRAAWD
jgi:hypothetical protein